MKYDEFLKKESQKKGRSKPRHIESQIQIQMVKWFRLQYPRYIIAAIPNGTYHHRQVVRVARIKEEIIATKHHEDVEQNSASRKHVECNTTFLETLEEARSYLETNHEDEEDQAEVLHECENFLWTGEANVASQNTCEENKGDT